MGALRWTGQIWEMKYVYRILLREPLSLDNDMGTEEILKYLYIEMELREMKLLLHGIELSWQQWAFVLVRDFNLIYRCVLSQ